MALYAKADVELLVDRDDGGHETPWRANTDVPEDLEVVVEADMRGAAATGLARARRKAIIYTIDFSWWESKRKCNTRSTSSSQSQLIIEMSVVLKVREKLLRERVIFLSPSELVFRLRNRWVIGGVINVTPLPSKLRILIGHIQFLPCSCICNNSPRMIITLTI